MESTHNTKTTKADLFFAWCKKHNVARGIITGLLGANIVTAYYNVQLEKSNDELNSEIYTITDAHFHVGQKIDTDGYHWLESLKDKEIARAKELKQGEIK